MKSKHISNKFPTASLLSLAIAAVLHPVGAQASGVAHDQLPTGGAITHGQGAINQAGAVMNITQSSQQLIANWESFNVGAGATVNFIQPNSQAMALNRVLSADPSLILGQINANGQIAILNPSGMVFGAGARVDVGALMVSTGELSDADFLANNPEFHGLSAGGAVINHGRITTKPGGYVVLAANQVSNHGEMIAPDGTVALAAGERVRMEISGGGLIGVQVDGETIDAAIHNTGAIVADNGRVLLTSRQASGALGAAINQEGIVRANTLSAGADGRVVLDGGQGRVQLAGTTEAIGVAAGTTGGTITATSDRVELSGTVDASGQSGGGEVYIGGGWQGKDPAIAEAREVVIDAAAMLHADATLDGDGGTIALWSGERTRHDGTITARGAGDGRGGKVETSSRGELGVSGRVDVSAESGQGGMWLLDPANLRVVADAGAPALVSNTNPDQENVRASSIDSALSGGAHVLLWADNNIWVDADITKAGSASTSAKLTFQAGNDIILGQGHSITVATESGRLDIDFGTSDHANGNIHLFGNVSTNGGEVNFYKTTYLRHANPVTTKITRSTATVGERSGNVTFHRDVYLAATGHAVEINAQGAELSGPSNPGGNVLFMGHVLSGTPVVYGGAGDLNANPLNWTTQAFLPQRLTVDTTGIADGSQTEGSITFRGNIGRIDAATISPLGGLVLRGPREIAFEGGFIDLRNHSGTVLSAQTNFSGSPSLLLKAAETVINVTGVMGQGYADYRQDTFNIIGDGVGDQVLVVNADRSILIDGHAIRRRTAGSGRFDVLLNPFVAAAAEGGMVVLDGAQITTYGGRAYLGGLNNTVHASIINNADGANGHAAVAVGTGNAGVSINNSIINTQADPDNPGGNPDVPVDGLLLIRGRGPEALVAGNGVFIRGADTVLRSGDADMWITGLVTTPTASGRKDAVVIGEGSSARSRLLTSSGNIVIQGDASSITNVQGGSHYIGTVLASSALIQSDSGDISIMGFGGGGNEDFISQNHGILLQNTNTSIVSASGDILLHGRSGGRVDDSGNDHSFGIYATSHAMYIGRDQHKSTASGDIIFIADSMQFVNTSQNRLQVGSDGHLLIRPESDNTQIVFGTGGSSPVVEGVKRLTLGSNWFDGSTLGIFQPAPLITAQIISAEPHKQQLNIRGNAGGTFKLVLGDLTTADIAFDSNVTTLTTNIQTALQALGDDYANTVVTGTALNNITVEFRDNTSAPVEAVLAYADHGRIGFAGITIGREDLTAPITVSSATTVRDDLTLMVGDYSGAYKAGIIVNSALTVQRQPNNVDGGTLTLIAHAGEGKHALVARGVITADALHLLGSGHFTATASNRINTLAAHVNGDITLDNNHALHVGSVSSDWVSDFTSSNGAISVTYASMDPGINEETDGITLRTASDQLDLRIATGDLTFDESITAGTVGLRASNGAILQQEDAIITANTLHLHAAEDSRLHNANRVGILSGWFGGSAGLEFHNAQSLTLDRVSLNRRTASTSHSDGTVASITQPLDGLDGNTGTLALKITGGDLTQAVTETQSRIRASSLLVHATNGDVTLANTTNSVGTLSAHLDGADKHLQFFNAGALRIGTVDEVGTGLVAAGEQAGVLTVANGNISIATVNGSLTVARNVTAGGNGWIDLRAGGATSDLFINPEDGATASIASDAGTIQLLAGRDIRTSYGTAETAAISTGGAILLKAGRGIGADNERDEHGDIITFHRIELADAPTLAAEAGSGGIWLRKLGVDEVGDALTIGSASSINSGQTVGGIIDGSFAGLVTTEDSNGHITLTTQGGNLLIASDITADGSGHVDLRTAGNIVIDGATIASGSGTLQLIAGGSITTTDGSDDLSTTGAVLLESGAHIGGEMNRIRLSDAATLAVRSDGGTANQWLAHTGGDLSVGEVVAVNAASSLDMSAVDRSGMIAVGDGLFIDLDVADALHLNAAVQADSQVRLTAGSIQQSTDEGHTINTSGLRIETRDGAARLDNLGNTITTLAAQTIGGGLSYADADGFTVDTVAGLSGIDSDDHDVTLYAADGNIVLAQAVDAGTGKVTLHAAEGAVTATAALITAAGLRMVARDASTLDHVGNNVETFSATLSGAGADLVFSNSEGFSVGTVATQIGTAAALGNGHGVRTVGGNIALTAAGDLRLAQLVSTGGTGAGTVALEATGAGYSIVRDTASGEIVALALSARADQDVLLTHPNDPHTTPAGTIFSSAGGNRVARLAGEAGGAFHFASQGSLVVDSVNGIDGVSAGYVWLRSQNDLTLNQAVSASATGLRAAVLAAGGQFRNNTGLGAAAIDTPNSGWLVYDTSLADFGPRFAGLIPDFTHFSTFYDSRPPGSVPQLGNGYLVGTPTIDPEHYLRVVGGETATSSSGSQSGMVLAIDTPPTGSTVEVTYSFQHEPLTTYGNELPLLPTSSGRATLSSSFAEGSGLVAPATVRVAEGQPFQIPLSGILGQAELVAVTLVDGSPLPEWLSLARYGRGLRLVGQLPEGSSGPIGLRVLMRDPNSGEEEIFEFDVVPQLTMASNEIL